MGCAGSRQNRYFESLIRHASGSAVSVVRKDEMGPIMADQRVAQLMDGRADALERLHDQKEADQQADEPDPPQLPAGQAGIAWREGQFARRRDAQRGLQRQAAQG